MQVKGIKLNNMSFKAGITNFYSDFDGTYMPYTHDSMVKQEPPIDKEGFKNYFEGFSKLFQKVRGQGKEPKLNFLITTGRNLNEFNYVMGKLKEQGLEIPLADSIITCNGQDEFFKNPSTMNYFSNGENTPYRTQDVNLEKRAWIKQQSNWDGKEIRGFIRKTLQDTTIIPNDSKRDDLFGKITGKDKRKLSELYNNIFKTQRNEEELRLYLEEFSKEILEKSDEEEKNNLKQQIKEVAHEIVKAKDGKYKFMVLEAPTNQCSWTYPGHISLQSQLEEINPSPEFYTSIRQDGDLGFHVAFPWNMGENIRFQMPKINQSADVPYTLQERLSEYGKTKGISFTIKSDVVGQKRFDDEAFNITGENTAALRIKPVLKSEEKFLQHGGPLDKIHDIQLKAKEIVDKNLDDLIIVAGNGSNDMGAIDLRNYVSDPAKLQNWSYELNKNDKKGIEELKKLPIISIFVNDGECCPSLNKYVHDLDKILNFDGQTRFIVVDKNDPEKPQTLYEAVDKAIKEYAKRNQRFRENLSSEMLDDIKNNE